MNYLWSFRIGDIFMWAFLVIVALLVLIIAVEILILAYLIIKTTIHKIIDFYKGTKKGRA